MSAPRTITAAERAARIGQTAPAKPIAQFRKKNPDGTRCATCKPIVVTGRSFASVSPLMEGEHRGQTPGPQQRATVQPST